ncbi:hypothetical protein [Terrisporobacter petrolearius]|uniref:hypothetical protein n=1 Tax=Terrisporobacter petrolearius TaxID=1460447 RepID=UPI0022E9746A|nr:hypothetical protein [Terrisporobacter petrolearius]
MEENNESKNIDEKDKTEEESQNITDSSDTVTELKEGIEYIKDDIKSMTMTDKLKMLGQWIIIAFIVIGVITYFSNKNSASQAIQDSTWHDSKLTIGESFDNYFSNGKWEEVDDNKVVFTGTGYYNGIENANVKITLEYNDKEFRFSNLEVNGVEQEILLLSAYAFQIMGVYDEYLNPTPGLSSSEGYTPEETPDDQEGDIYGDAPIEDMSEYNK